MTTFARYLAFQAPGWGAVFIVAWVFQYFAEMGEWLPMAGLAVFVAKDLAMFPFVKRAYEHAVHDPGSHVVGSLGVVVVDIDAEGWVTVGSERWRAIPEDEDSETLLVGQAVRVTGLSGHRLRVEAYE